MLESRRLSSVGTEEKLVDDPNLNNELLQSTFDHIDQASRLVKYDLRRKMSYFQIEVDANLTSSNLLYSVQKQFHMIELYHLILRETHTTVLSDAGDDLSNNSDTERQHCESTTISINEKRGHTIKELFSINNSGESLNSPVHVKLPRLNCKIIGLRSMKAMDGVDFMLSMPNGKLDYLEDSD